MAEQPLGELTKGNLLQLKLQFEKEKNQTDQQIKSQSNLTQPTK